MPKFVLILLSILSPIVVMPALATNTQSKWQWPQSEPKSVGIDKDKLNIAHSKIRRGKYQQIDSLLVIRNGQLVFEKYYNKGKKSRPHVLASAGKSILSAMVGISIDKNQIRSTNDKVYDYFANFYQSYEHWDDAKASITIHDLLTMRAGWKCSIRSPANQCGSEMYKGREPIEAIKWVLDRPMAFKPGERMLYTDAIPNLLWAIVNLAAGSTSAISYEKDLFGPIGIPLNTPAQLTSRQMARFGQLFLNKGKWQGKQVISSQWVTKSTSAIYPLHKSWAGQANGYGYFWWVGKFDSKTTDLSVDGYYAAGNGGQYIVVLPALDMVIVFTGSNFNDLKIMRKPLDIIEKFILPAVDNTVKISHVPT